MVLIPLRTCVACREQRPQEGLIRISRTAAGVLEVFAPVMSRAAKGRSAYVCPTFECVERALKESRKRVPLGYALRTKIDSTVEGKIRAILGATYDDLSESSSA